MRRSVIAANFPESLFVFNDIIFLLADNSSGNNNEESSHTTTPSSSILSYDEHKVTFHDSIDDLNKDGHNIWVDLVNPSSKEIATLQKRFALSEKALEKYNDKSKKAQAHIFGDQVFIVILILGFKNARTLTSESIYLFAGQDWLITVHPSRVEAIEETRRLFRQKDAQVMSCSVNNIYYSIITNVVESYEQILTSIELTIASLGEVLSSRDLSHKTLDKLDVLSKQIIILRRHFWHTRHIVNFLLNAKEGKDEQEVKILKGTYNEINQLIDLIESLRDSINSTRDLYTASVSLQLNDTMRTLTIFSSILLPLTFVVGLFGMNGLNLNYIGTFPVGLLLVTVAMAIFTGILFVFFRYKRWILVPKKSTEGEEKSGKSPAANGDTTNNSHRQ